ncbi:hypothetical protein Gohar_009112 [Gossypium harknessii]|uniref:DUF7745 domain-containing protein n=1 Tax=Gossypium harknessii TaxID=34285 RepID=A0A7J9GLS7_9ROSI|nr:hypothetical protein [Gossypium harknessii]
MVLIRVQLLNTELIMEKRFLDKVEDNAAVRIWSEKRQQEKDDSLSEGNMSELWDFTRISLFYHEYADLPYLLDVKVDKYLFRALAQYWNLAYNCFTFGKLDLVQTVEEYTTLLRYLRIQVSKAYSKAANVPTVLKRLMNITGMSEQWVATRMKQKKR